MAKDMTRLGLFVFFDPQGIVDDYVLHLLEALRPHFTKLVVISNGELGGTAQSRLNRYADSLFTRENRGLDAAAYKAGLVSFCGWEEAERYDEVVLINDTFYGPIHSFTDMFAEMSDRELDFWGISAGYHAMDGWHQVKYGYVPDHIQTFFVAFRKNMVCSAAFHEYWERYDDSANDFISVVSQNEVVLTRHFQDLGFRWEIYADTQRYRSDYHSENFNLYHYLPHTMMRDMGFPILKRKVLNVDLPLQLAMQDLESGAEAMAYVSKETDYDTGMIWDNALRLYNVRDLYDTLHLNYVLPSVPVSLPENRRIALVYRVGNPFFARQLCSHAIQHCAAVDVYMIPEDPQAAQLLRQETDGVAGITVLEGSGQKTEMGTFALCCGELARQYDYLGFVHDALNTERASTTIAQSKVYGYLQNAANDPAYLSQVIQCFEKEPRLGVLGVPFPHHDYGFGTYADSWQDSFETVQSLSGKLKLNCNIKKEKPPFMTVSAFWCRTAAIRALWNKSWSAGDFACNPVTDVCKTHRALTRLLPYCAQSAGYYSGIVMHTNYASMRLTGQQSMLSRVTQTLQTGLGIVPGRYRDYLDQLERIHYKDKETPMSIDLSELTFSMILRLWLERKAPHWLTRRALQLARFGKNRKK